MKKTKEWLQLNSKGLSLVELIVALGAATIVGIAISQLLLTSGKALRIFEKTIDASIDDKLGDKLILRDLRNSAPSMNNLIVNDDCGKSFFDFDTDRNSIFYLSQQKSGSSVACSSASPTSRTFTLEINKKTALYFLTYDQQRGGGIFTDALSFFSSPGAAPTNMNAPAPIAYEGLGFNDFLNQIDIKNSSKLNTAKQLILVDSSVAMPVSPARGSTFLGLLDTAGGKLDLIKITFPILINNPEIFNYAITFENSLGGLVNYVPNNFKEYLIYLPSAGAGGASVRLKPILIQKYSLDCVSQKDSNNKQLCLLLRETLSYSNASTSTLSKKITLLSGYRKITFKRDDIASSVFEIATEK